MFCKNCGKEMQENQAICLGCGVKKNEGNKHCANCGNEVAENASVCLKCGVAIKGGKNYSSNIGEKINAEDIKNIVNKENIMKKPNLFISVLSILFLFLPFIVISASVLGYNSGSLSGNAFQIIFGLNDLNSDFICILLLILPILIIISYLTNIFKSISKYIKLISPIVGLGFLMIFRTAYVASYGNVYISANVSAGFGFWLSVIAYIAMTIFAIIDFRKHK